MARVKTHPGCMLRAELGAGGMSANQLVLAIRVPTNRITAILRGERAVTAERALTRALGADCTTPLGAYATVDGERITLRATLLGPEGDHARSVVDAGTDALELGERLARALVRLGARV